MLAENVCIHYHRRSIGKGFLASCWFHLYAKPLHGASGCIIKLEPTPLFQLFRCLMSFCHLCIIVLTYKSHVPGVIKLALLLWDTWISQGKLASALFQHGTFGPPQQLCFPTFHPYMLLCRFTQGCFLMLCAGSTWQWARSWIRDCPSLQKC